MATLDDVRVVLTHSLQLGLRGRSLEASSALLGSLPELDSMAVVTLLTALEDRFGIVIEDDDISADNLGTLGSLAKFVESKLSI